LLPPVFLDYYLNDAGGYDVPRLPLPRPTGKAWLPRNLRIDAGNNV
jgi:hypothetical protein